MTDTAAPITDDELAALFVETGHHHHESYIDADGVDPDWALWYAPYIQARLWGRLGRVLTRSEIVYLLIDGDLAVRRGESDVEWPVAYARRFRAFAEASP